MRLGRALCLCAVAALVARATRADEGMWPLGSVPRDEIEKRYGVDVTDAWLERVRLASVRFNSGGSGAFVSATGLVITNHHVAADVLSKVSTPEHDYFETGFYAKTPAEEAKAPDLELNVLESIENVTARVTAAAAPGMTAAAANEGRRAAIAAIEKESLAATGLRSDVVTLYGGGEYDLYRYKRYTDVRLVFAPEQGVAFFGGDPDNFEYPRYDLDVAIFRVYEDGVPVKPPAHLPWSRTGAAEGDLVFVSGNPGSTSRLDTVAHLLFLRDHDYPYRLRRFESLRGVLEAYTARGPEQARQAHEELFRMQNSRKVVAGQLRGLQDEALVARKRRDEDALRAAVAKTPALAAEASGAWDAVAAARAGLAGYNRERLLVEGANGFNSELFRIARTLVRLAAEDQKPNGQRLHEFVESGRASLELGLYSAAPIYTEFEVTTLAESLGFLRSELGAENPIVRKALAGRGPEERSRELVVGSRLADVAVRRQLAAGGQKAIDESTDPMIALARAVDPDARALRRRYEDEVEAVEQPAYAKIAHAGFAVFGSRRYPDATFTLRLAFGVVRGYEQDGARVPAFTDWRGMQAKAAAAGNRAPYRLPERWLAAKAALTPTTPLDFVTTADTIGGNSGSPIVNANGEIVGVNFDRNAQGLVRNFVYDERQARNVAVDARAILEALRTVCGASALAEELTR